MHTFACEFRYHDPDAQSNPCTAWRTISAKSQTIAEREARTIARSLGWRFAQARAAVQAPTLAI